jgi:pre-mRNA-splicing factor ATP-dependent RNA helicase DHX16
MKQLRAERRAQFLKEKAAVGKVVHDNLLATELVALENGQLPKTQAELELMERRLRVDSALGQLQSMTSQGERILASTAGASGEQDTEPLVVRSYADLERENQAKFQASATALDPLLQEQVDQEMGKRKRPRHELLLTDEELEALKNQEQANSREPTQEELELARLELISSKYRQLQEKRRSLPMFAARERLLAAVKNNSVIILKGETGSGKTTQMLQYLYEAGYCKEVAVKEDGEELNGEEEKPLKVGSPLRRGSGNEGTGGGGGKKLKTKRLKLACTQPRRIAATSVAERVAEEMNTRCGQLVGYKVRFDEKITPGKTLIEFVTDGMLLKELPSNPLLEGYAAVMIDEAHERSVPTDILLARLKAVVHARPDDFKLIVASATLNIQKFIDYFEGAPVIEVEGRMFPVEVNYLEAAITDYVEASVTAVMDIHLNQPLPGDVLIFMPGQDDIEKCAARIEEELAKLKDRVRPVIICPVYGNLPHEEQQRIYAPTPEDARKVVIATNIAETSITVEGIVYVIDTGLVKQNYYNPNNRIDALNVVPVSKAQAGQRKGRAGRTQDGVCIRLYTEHMYNHELPDATIPEILRANLSSIVLTLITTGVTDLLNFDFIDPPAVESVCAALDVLKTLGAIKIKRSTGQLALTDSGRKMAEFPLDPTFGRMLVKSGELGCSREAVIVCAVLSLQNSLFAQIPREKRADAERARQEYFVGASGDIQGYVRLFLAWEREGAGKERWAKQRFLNFRSLQRAQDVRGQLLSIMERLDIPLNDVPDLLQQDQLLAKAFTSGFFINTAKLNADRTSYHVIKTRSMNASVEIHPSSCLFAAFAAGREKPELVVFSELRQTTKAYMNHVMAVPAGLLYARPPAANAIEAAKQEARRKELSEALGVALLGPEESKHCVAPQGFFTEVELGIDAASLKKKGVPV